MTQPDTGTTGEKTFTQAELDAVVRDRLKREREKYADYDTLKAAAAGAEANKTQLDKVLEKLTAAEERAAKLEEGNLRGSVATAKKLPAFLAKKLSGKTKEELEADADEMLAEWKAAGGKTGDDTTEESGTEGGTTTQQPATAQRGRPKETLRSGAPRTETTPEETDPRKLAELIPRQ
jgi:hypothetical protein